MSSHFYLLRKSIKNWFLQLIRKPSKFFLCLLVVIAVIAGMVGSLMGAEYTEGTVPTLYFSGIFFGFLLIFYGIAIQKGLASGNTLFDMNDVNLLFVAPVNPRATLLYGVFRMLATSFGAGFFILFQSSTLSRFGIDFSGIIILFGMIIITTMVLTLLSLVIYTITNGDPARKRIARVVSVAVFIPLIAYFVLRWIAVGDPLAALPEVLQSPFFSYTPILGWASAGAIALIQGQVASGLFYIGLLLLSGIGMVCYIMFGRSDYYEDVLVATETAYEKKRAQASGDMQAMSSTTGNVKVRGTGISGRGASAFLYKHLRETLRQNRFAFFGTYAIMMTLGFVAASIFLFSDNDVMIILNILMWTQIFMIGTGRGLLEMYSHYLYMVPVSAFAKVIYSNLELVVRTALESVLFFLVPGLIMGSNLFITLLCMLTFVLFSMLLLGVNYLFMRVSEANISQGIMMMVYFVAVLLIMAPGLAAALSVGFSMGGVSGTIYGLLILSAWEFLASLACFAMSKNTLHNCDMPTAPKRA